MEPDTSNSEPARRTLVCRGPAVQVHGVRQVLHRLVRLRLRLAGRPQAPRCLLQPARRRLRPHPHANAARAARADRSAPLERLRLPRRQDLQRLRGAPYPVPHLSLVVQQPARPRELAGGCAELRRDRLSRCTAHPSDRNRRAKPARSGERVRPEAVASVAGALRCSKQSRILSHQRRLLLEHRGHGGLCG